jgi:putative FmdB family regulatory protein
MPTYEYACYACQHKFDFYQSIHDDTLTECPLCSVSGQIEKLISIPMFIFVRGEPTTVMQQAERNAQRVGKDGMAERKERHREAKKKAKQQVKLPKGATLAENTRDSGAPPWWRDGSIPGTERSEKPLKLDNVTNVEKFLLTGTK